VTNGRQHRLALPAGYKLHWYEIESVLGQGGFGITYLARDTNLDQPVAIKEFLPTDLAVRTHDSSVQPISEGHTDTYGWGLGRFITEAQTLAKFRHPNIVLARSVFEANNTAYMVMEYVKGRTLEDALRFKNIEGELEFKRITFAILDGLELIHKEGFIHRDIKPENIYLRADGTPILLDFGSARQAVGGKTRTLTALVSPGYAPFEQYDNSRQSEDKQGPWTDIYALGATLYRAVTGHGPSDSLQRMSAVVDNKDTYQPLVPVDGRAYSSAFLGAIDWALEFKPGNRPQSIEDWRKALSGELQPDADTKLPQSPELKQAIPSPAAATKPATIEAIRDASKPRKRRGLLRGLSLGGLVLVVLVGGGYWLATSTGPLRQSPPAEPVASAEPLAEPGIEVEVAKAEPEQKPSEKAAEAEQLAKLKQEQEEAQARTKQRQAVARLLELAAADVEAGRLTSPTGENALERYIEVLKLEPNNTAASEGKHKIFTHFLEIGKALIEEENFPEAEKALSRAEAVEPGSVAVRLVRVRLNEAKQDAENRALIEQRKLAQEALQQKAEDERAQQRALKIQTLLSAADTDLKALRLTSPPGNNAFEGYQSVLELDPENDRAPEGLLEIVNRYLEFRDRAVEQNDFDKAQGYLEKAETVLPGSELLADARAELDAVRAAAEAERLAKAQAESERLKREQEKLKSQMQEKTAQPTQTEVPKSIPPIAVAVFPFVNIEDPGDAETLLPEFARRYISDNRQLQLWASYYGYGQNDSKIGDRGDYWSGGNRPLADQIYSHGARIGADAVLMFSYYAVFTNKQRFAVTIYLFDVKNRHTYKATGNQDDYERVTERLFEEFLQSWKGAPAPSAMSAASAGRKSDQLARAQAELEGVEAEEKRIEALVDEVVPEKVAIELFWESDSGINDSYSKIVALRDGKLDAYLTRGTSRTSIKGEFAKDGFSLHGTILETATAYSRHRNFKINGKLTDGQFSSNFQTGVGAPRSGYSEYNVKLNLKVVE
jgi:serine/threonine protein kinase